MAGTDAASNRASSSGTSSRSEELSLQITEVPHRRASSTGSPRPSYSDGKTTRCAAWYSSMSTSSGTYPVKVTSPAIPRWSSARLRSSSCAGLT